MKILVPIKRVVDYNVRIRVKSDGSDVELANVKMGINPFCEIAVEEGVTLREAGVASELVVVTFGPEAAAEQFQMAVFRWPAFADAPEALQRLRRHFKLVTMTNAQRWALEHFDATLGHPFDLLLSCDDALCEKPDPRYFAYARGRYEGAWGYTQPQNLHVAQSQYHDIGIARRLGLATCWIERRAGQKGFGGTIAVEEITQPDYHYRTLAELADAVEAGL